MNEQNLQYLKDNLKYLGFGERSYPELEKNIYQGFPEFQLRLQTEYNEDTVSTILYFRKSDTSDHYFFNSYEAVLQKPGGEKRDHMFYVNNGNGITSKEAYNLLNGRAVYKNLRKSDGQKYSAWIQLDLQSRDDNGNFKIRQYHQNYGYDLEKVLRHYPIKELEEPGSTRILLCSLEKGNLQSVTFEKDENKSRLFVEANPRFKTVNVYDAMLKRVPKEVLEQYRSFDESNGKKEPVEAQLEKKEKDEEETEVIDESEKQAPLKAVHKRRRLTHQKST